VKCSIARKWLWAYLEGAAPARVQRDIEAHVAGCPGCAGELAAVRALDQAVTQAVLDAPTPDLTGTILAAVAGEPVGRSRPALSNGARRWTWVVAPAGGIAALAAGTVVLSLLARLWLWRLALAGVITPPPALTRWLSQTPAGWLARWSAVETALAGAHAVVSRVPAPGLLAAGLVLALLQTWAVARFLAYWEDGRAAGNA